MNLLPIKRTITVMFCLLMAWVSNPSADQFHFIDIHVGERASGMAGAYTAVSDDPSGAYYNPAGIAFSDQSYISLSTNTFKWSQSTYINVLADIENSDNNWENTASAFIPNFFGFIQSYDQLKIAFTFIVPEGTEANQDNRLLLEYNVPSNNIDFIRNYNEKNYLYLAGPSVAYEVSDSLAIGASMFLANRTREFTDNQWFHYVNRSNEFAWDNFYSEESSTGIISVLGIQYMPSKTLSLGFTLKNTFDFKATATQQVIRTTQTGTSATINEFDLIKLGYQTSPTSLTGGFAYFMSPYLLWTGDLKYYAANTASNIQFRTKNTINIATAIEYYATLNLPIRFGFYTNNSNREFIYSGSTNVDLKGITFSFGLENELSTLSLGLDYSWGSGKIGLNEIDDMVQVFNANIQTLQIFFSGSYKI